MEGTAASSSAALEQRLKECRTQGAGQRLNLACLDGGLPPDFVALVLHATPNVVELDLSSNQLTDEQLSGDLAQLRKLRVLRLKYNCLQRLPPVLAELPQLAVLELPGNRLEALDGTVLAQLSALRDLDLSSCGLRALPEEIAALPDLESLRLGNNSLEALPPQIGGCRALARLDVSSNRLLALPPELVQLARLQRVDAKNNFITRVPPCLGHLRGLKELDLRYNRLNKSYAQATEKGLARFLSWLRDEEEIERLQEIERNKPVGLQLGPCTAYKCCALTADAVASLGGEGDGDKEFAWIRTGHSVCMADKVVYMFGGSVLKDSGKKTADLFWLSTDRMEWRLQPTKGDKPCPRDGHCMVFDDVCNRLVVFGGRKQNRRRLNDVYFLDLTTWTWFSPRTEGVVPSPRDQCSAAFHDGKMLIFGGRSSSTRLNELHVLDLDTWSWLVPEVSGSAPSPRQGAAVTVHDDKLWVHGGRSNFVLDDCYCLDMDTGEWSAVPSEGRVLPARHGHIITHVDSMLHLFGGTDALGAQVPTLFKLRRTGPTRHEWVETSLTLPPNKFRIAAFSNGRLNSMEVSHPALKLQVPAADLAAGRAVWDVFQWASLKDVQERAVRPEDLIPKNAKLERIAHCLEEAAGLPPGFTSSTSRERQILHRAAEFKAAWRQRLEGQQVVGQSGGAAGGDGTVADGVAVAVAAGAAGLLEPPLVLKNECGVDKLVCTTLRPTCLPHVELHDMEGVVQFVSEYIRYEPLEHPSQPPAHLVSPWSLLDWQAGDSFDLATLECSMLLGAGYNACVAVGFVPKPVALGDQSSTDCPYLAGLGIAQKPAKRARAEGKGGEVSDGEAEAGEGVEGSGSGGLGRISEAEESGLGTARLSQNSDSRPATAAAGADGSGGVAEGQGAAEEQLEAAGVDRESAAGVQLDSTEAARAAGAAGEPQPEGSSAEAAVAAPEAAAPAAAEAGASSAEGAASEADAQVPGIASTEAGIQQEGAVTATAAAEPAQQAPTVPAGPPRYLHAFVLVKPGGKEVTQSVFIDPPTAMCYAPEELPCEGISFMWNQHNFWANLQQGENEGQLAAPAATDWNLANPNAWEALVPSGSQDGLESQSVSSEFSASGGNSSFLRTTQSRASLLEGQPVPSSTSMGSAGGSRFAAQRSSHSVAGTPAGSGGGGGGLRSQRKSTSLQVMAAKNAGTPRLASHAPTREFEAGGSLSYLAPSSGPEEPNTSGTPRSIATAGRYAGIPSQGVEMPPSWVPQLVLSRERMDVRCPKGKKTVQYRQCQRDIFARFGECSRWDGLVERYTLFEDAECTRPEVVVELFQRRKDKLQRRETYPATRLVKDSFGRGATGALRESSVIKGDRRELGFYQEDRADGLLRRVEVVGVSMEEFFLGRPDRLLSRKVKYGPPDVTFLGAGQQRRGSLMLGSATRRDSLATPATGDSSSRPAGRKSSVMGVPAITYPMACISEKSGRDPEVPCDQDVAKRTFDLEEHTVAVACHYGEDDEGMGRPGRAVRVYGPSGEVLENWGAADAPSEEWCALEYGVRLTAAKKAAVMAAKAAEEESQELATARMRQEQNVQLVTGHYDAMRTKVEDSDDEPEGPEENEQDYLAPFLPPITGTRDMTAQEAAAVFHKCVQAMKARATEGTAAMEARRSSEAAEIKRLEGRVAEELQSLSAVEQQRLQEQLEEARFRARVLGQRLADHSSVTAEKLRELEAKLRADPRLLPAVKARLV